MEQNKDLQIIQKIQKTIQVEKQRRIETTDALENGMKKIEEIIQNYKKANEQMKQDHVIKLKALETEKMQLENEKKQWEKEKKIYRKQLEDATKEISQWSIKDIETLEKLANKESECQKIKGLNTGLQQELNKLTSMCNHYKDTCGKYYRSWELVSRDVQQRDEQIRKLQYTQQEGKRYIADLESQVRDGQVKVQSLETDKEKLSTRRLADKESECQKIRGLNTGLQQDVQQRDQQIRNLQYTQQECRRDIDDLESQVRDGKMKIQSLETEKYKLLKGLSKIAGAKLTQGNAAITDLSDANRPMKIAEKYSELYDNEWTDALEELLDKVDDDNRGIAILLEIITGAYKFCSETAEKYQEGMTQSAVCLPVQPLGTHPLAVPESCDSQRSQQTAGAVQELIPKTIQLTEEQKKILYDLRRKLCPQLLHLVEEHFLDILNELLLKAFGKVKQTVVPCDHSRQGTADNLLLEGGNKTKVEENKIIEAVVLDGSFDKTKSFARKCANLCWFMRIKDPPLHMMYEVSYGCPMDTESFKHYTQSGKLVKFLVWPALFLHKEGALLEKGVAQPMKKSEEKEFNMNYSSVV